MNLIIGTIFGGDEEIWSRLRPKRPERRVLGLDRSPCPAGESHAISLSSGSLGYAYLRNEFIELVRAIYPQTGWLLFLDADEFMTPESLARLTQALPHLRDHCYYFPRINYVLDEKTYLGGDHYPDYQARLLRLSSPARYSGAVHECVEGVARLPFPNPAPHIHHYGLLRDPAHVFALRRKYAGLQGAYHPEVMPPDYGQYPTLLPKLPVPVDHLLL